ncbi:MAG: prolipoprotein diacylglyceryl transferase family protein [Saprospiraceae bacterium]
MPPLSYSITPDITGTLYDFFAHTGLLFFFLICTYEAHRRKFPMAAWLLSLAIIVSLTLFGTRIAVFDIAAWQTWWQEGIFPIATQRTALGAAVFIFPSIWLIKKGLRFKAPILDTLAFAIPVIAIMRRLGCLAAACCYGLPTENGWGLRYLGPSVIRDQHWAETVLGADRFGSAAVHPVPVYFIIAALLTLFLLKKYKSTFKRIGSQTLFVIVLLLGFRFYIEFFRDPMTNHQLGDYAFGLKKVQWFLLLITTSLSLMLWYREKQTVQDIKIITPALSRMVYANVLLGLFIYWMQDSFLIAEKVGIHSLLMLSLIALFVEAIRSRRPAEWQNWKAAFVVLLALVMMSQSYPKHMDSIEEEKTLFTLQGNWNKMNLGAASYNCTEVQSGCGGSDCVFADSLSPIGPEYQQFSIGINGKRFRPSPRKRWKPGMSHSYVSYINFGLDVQPEFFYNEALDYRTRKYNIMPYVGWGTRQVEFTFGLRIGRIWNNQSNGSNIPEDNAVVGAFTLRIGSTDGFYFYGNINNSSAFGASVGSFNGTFNMNLSNYTNNHLEYLRFGLSNFHHNVLYTYIEPAFNIGEKFLVTPRFGLTYRSKRGPEFRQSFREPAFGMGLYYRLN